MDKPVEAVTDEFLSSGFCVQNILPGEAIFASFSNLVLDAYSGGGSRYRRFSQYKLASAPDSHLSLLPHRPFVQSKKYNNLVGGTLREFMPLECDPSQPVLEMARVMALDKTQAWQINVHQIQTRCGPESEGIVVPEGPHQDGHMFVALWVVNRHNIEGGITTLLPLGSKTPFFERTLGNGEALMFDDRMMRHDTTNIRSLGPASRRESFIIVFNPWKTRKYGVSHEAEATR